MRFKLGLNLGSGSGGGAAFNPSDLNPLAWYDFSDASLLFTDAGTTPVSGDGDIIYQANDKTANGNDLTQSTLANRPIYKTGIQNGLSVGRFDGVDDSMLATFASQSQPNTIFCAANVITTAFSKFVFDGNHPTDRNALFSSGTGEPLMFTGSNFVGSGLLAGVSLYTCSFDGASSIFRKNGASLGTGDPGPAALQGFRLGSNNTGGSSGQIDAFEIIIVPGTVSAEDIQNMETYLNSLWSIY